MSAANTSLTDVTVTCDDVTNQLVALVRRELRDVASSTDVTVMTWLLSTVALLGCLGNGLVIVVCIKFSRRVRTAQFFILVLAVSDLLLCCLVIPYRIATYHCLFPQLLCKLLEGTTYIVNMYSYFIIILVAADRYLAVCHPTAFALTLTRAHVSCAVLAALSVVLGLPAGLVAGRYVTAPHSDVTCFTGVCFGDGGDYRVLTEDVIYIYSVFWFLVFLLLVLIVLTLYSLVFNSLRLRHNTKRRRSKERIALGALRYSAANIAQDFTDDVIEQCQLQPRPVRVSDTHRSPTWCVETTDDGAGEGHVTSRSGGRDGTLPTTHYRVAKILLLVSVAFIALWLPFFLIKLHIVPNITTVRLTFFISAMINPIIYSFTNRNFRHNVITLILHNHTDTTVK